MNHPHHPPVRREHRRDGGFTLVELLVVMVVIGILAAIAVPVFTHQRATARDTAVKSDLRAIATSVRGTGMEKGTYPTARELNDAGVVLRTSPTVRAAVLWRSATDFCLVGTSSAGGVDTSGLGQPVGITTKVYAVSATRGPAVVTSSDPGCLGTPGVTLSGSTGFWAEDGFHGESLGF